MSENVIVIWLVILTVCVVGQEVRLWLIDKCIEGLTALWRNP